MPDNAIYYHVAYAAIIGLFAGYALSISIRRSDIAKKREAAERRK